MTGAREAPIRLARELEEELRRRGSDERRRVVTEGYAPTALAVLGTSAPDLRSVLRGHRRDLRALAPDQVVELARALVEGGTLEGRVAGYEVLGARPEALDSLDVRAAELLGEGNDAWPVVDAFGVTVTGPAWRRGALRDRDIRGWAGSPDRWWRRTALVSTVALNLTSRGGVGDARRTLAVARVLADDEDPMVRKALSWALRALVPRDRNAVEAFLEDFDARLPARVRREVRNKLATGRKNPRGMSSKPGKEEQE